MSQATDTQLKVVQPSNSYPAPFFVSAHSKGVTLAQDVFSIIRPIVTVR